MQPNEINEFTRVLSSVSVLYAKAMSKALVELYWAALSSFELGAVKQALQSHVQSPDTGQYMPKPADVVRFLQGDSRTQALQAWSRVVSAMRAVGGYGSVVFDDPLVHAVIHDMGGWITLCQTVEKDLPFRGADFTARYVGFVGRPPAHYPKQLTGLTAHQNALQGYKSDPPVCLGDPQKALQVYQQGQWPGPLYTALPAQAESTALTTSLTTEEGQDD
jgi:hypothetical protein